MTDEGLDKTRLYRTSSKRLSTPLIITVVLLLSVLLGGAYVFYQAQQKSTQNVESPLPTVTQSPTDRPTATPDVSPTESDEEDEVSPTSTRTSPSPSARPTARPTGGSSVDRSDISLVVLNGSGTPGAAGKFRTYLEGLGYTVSRTGNADAFDYEDITISVKAGNTALLNQLRRDLQSQGTIGEATATYTGTGDAQVIIGQ